MSSLMSVAVLRGFRTEQSCTSTATARRVHVDNEPGRHPVPIPRLGLEHLFPLMVCLRGDPFTSPPPEDTLPAGGSEMRNTSGVYSPCTVSAPSRMVSELAHCPRH